MAEIYLLNVKEGDCTWIKHSSGHNTIIDISNGNAGMDIFEKNESVSTYDAVRGNYNQKAYPVDPIEFLKGRGVNEIFRFILTHPDMDHMDGIKAFFDTFEVCNFWDTENNKQMKLNENWGPYEEEDWNYYQSIRNHETDTKVLNLYAGCKGQYYNKGDQETSDGDGLYILAPTRELVDEANKSGDYNDCSYVILYKVNGKKIVFGGDSAEKTWDYILENHKDDVTDVDILIAPHHGRKTGGNRKYLDVLRPKLTLFGNAKSKYLGYADWNNRNLEFITNNQANNIILDMNNNSGIDVYVAYDNFARNKNKNTSYSKKYKAWYVMTV